ncbi:MAG: hypothetical protein M3O71_16535 [Bacteroidota bacterium]|nr:hypothetical protein [Bacteroidota bacterium]
MNKLFLSIIILISYAKVGLAQNNDVPISAIEKKSIQTKYDLDQSSTLSTRVTKTPTDVLKDFSGVTVLPKEHPLTAKEQEIVDQAFAILPTFTKKVLKNHLQGISFLDNMPNTALTSPVDTESYRIYHITIRAAILKQTVSEWLTEKEHTCFDTSGSKLTLSVVGGKLNALVYVLLHESTHIVDGSLGMFNQSQLIADNPWRAAGSRFAGGVWIDRTSFVPAVQDTLILKNHFRRGPPMKLERAVQAYQALATLPLVSFYSTASWNEDLAEYVAISYLTQRLHQPFKVTISQNGTEIFRFDPMHSQNVKSRNQIMEIFNKKKS